MSRRSHVQIHKPCFGNIDNHRQNILAKVDFAKKIPPSPEINVEKSVFTPHFILISLCRIYSTFLMNIPFFINIDLGEGGFSANTYRFCQNFWRWLSASGCDVKIGPRLQKQKMFVQTHVTFPKLTLVEHVHGTHVEYYERTHSLAILKVSV